jgi:VCBS repeat-containing protein
MPASMADIRKQIAECSAASNTAPTFVGATTTLTVAQSASATDLKSLLHVSDSDSGQTETWTQSSAPSHGTLTISGATASSGSADLTPGGTLTYTPTAGYAGADSFTVQVSDGTASAARTISVTVSAPTVTVSALTLNSMTVGTLFTPQSFSGAGGTGTYTYSVSAGLLPAGLSLDASSGALTGTPTTAGAYSFTIQTTDSSTGTSAPFSGTRAFSGSVAAAAAGACDSSSDGQTLTSAPSALCASGSASSVTSGNTLYTWTCAGGGAPASCSATRHYLVTPSAGTNGSLSPSAAQSVAYNATPSFTASPSSGHDLQSVSGCAGSLSGSSYTTGAITADCTVAARFSYRVRLNDTGASQCYDGSGLAACSRANSGNAAAHPRQDGRFGRDAAQAAGQLAAKTGGGAAGFDFTPLDASGTVLALTGAPPVPSATPACTRDNVTGLLWEVKTAANKANLYSFAATAAYASAANSASLCGASSGWRLPSRRELLSLVHHGASNPAIDGDYFPNTDSSGYWTGDPYAVPASTSVWKVDFYTGEAAEQDPAGTIRARLVRSGP